MRAAAWALPCVLPWALPWVLGAAACGSTPALETPQRRADAIIASFTAGRKPVASIDLGPAFGGVGREALLDPRAYLPDAASGPYDTMRALRDLAHCASDLVDRQDLVDRHDLVRTTGTPRIAKAILWGRFLCSQTSLPDDFFATAPWTHPLGGSFVARAIESGREPFSDPAWQLRHRDGLHVAEWARHGDRSSPLAGLSLDGAASLAAGAASALSPRWVFLRVRSGAGLGGGATYGVYERSEWDAATYGAGLVLGPAGDGDACLVRSGAFCWRNDTTPLERRGRLFAGAGIGALVLGLLAAGAALVARARARAREHAERLFIVRTLAHELRTPATSLALGLEPLRDDFDRLSAAAQSAFLQLCDEVQRLHRLVDGSAHYLQSSSDARVELADLSLIDLVLEVASEHGSAVEVDASLQAGGPEVRTDHYWLSLCVKNLLANAVTHGAPPVRVWIDGGPEHVAICVADGGELPSDLAPAPFAKGAKSRGLGLGLSIVADIMPRLGGTLTWTREPTLFRLTVPRARSGR